MSTADSPAPVRRGAIAPGPKGHPLFGMLPEFRGDRLGFLVRTARQYGGVARFLVRGVPVHLITDPAGTKRVLQDNADNYGRKTRSVQALRETLGSGLLTTTGPAWWRNRRLAQPSFHKQRLASFAGIMASSSADFVERLARGGPDRATGAPFDVVPEFSRLALRILGLCLFERDLTDEADAVGGAVQVVLHHTIEKLAALLPLPGVIPTPKNLRFRAALRALDRVVLSLIAERRRDGADRGDLLSMLLAARDEETGEGLSDEQLRDEVMTLLLAGHETTAMSLSWTFYLLSLHPGARRALERELDTTPEGAAPEQLAPLRYTRMVLDESLRLYPPAWVITRSADGDDEIGGFAIPAGSRVLLSPYVTQHDPALWDDPEGFDPERFAPSAAHDARPRYAYYPFGGGPHLCIGAGFAIMEATIVLAMVARRLHLDLEPGRAVSIDPLVTLRPKPGIWVTARPR